MTYIPHTPAEREAMLKVIGVNRLEELFPDVPAAYRFPHLDLPSALTEMEALAEMESYSLENDSTHDLACFLGAGAYQHYIPCRGRFDLAQGRVLYSLHTLPAGNFPGYAAGNF